MINAVTRSMYHLTSFQRLQAKRRKLTPAPDPPPAPLPLSTPEALDTIQRVEREYQERAEGDKSSIGILLEGERANCDECGTSLPDLHRSCGGKECGDESTFCMDCPDRPCSVCEQPLDVFDYSKDDNNVLHPYAAKARHFCDVHLPTAMERAKEGVKAAKGESSVSSCVKQHKSCS